MPGRRVRGYLPWRATKHWTIFAKHSATDAYSKPIREIYCNQNQRAIAPMSGSCSDACRRKTAAFSFFILKPDMIMARLPKCSTLRLKMCG